MELSFPRRSRAFRQAETPQHSGKLVSCCLSGLPLLGSQRAGGGCGRGRFNGRKTLFDFGKVASPDAIERGSKAWWWRRRILLPGIHVPSLPTQGIGDFRMKRERVEGLEEHALHAEIGEAALVGALHLGREQEHGNFGGRGIPA
jgi:hypothetical protein